jgi:hypothetical protein
MTPSNEPNRGARDEVQVNRKVVGAAGRSCRRMHQFGPSGPSQIAHPATVTGSTPVPYALYTHCGIGNAKIGGCWFEADHPLSDGSGNPPPG